MAEICLSIATSSPCFDCQREVSFTDNICPHCSAVVFPRYTAKEIYFMFYDGSLIDARRGGLVIGRDSSEDDIPLITPVSDGIFQFAGLMQGGEFIVNQRATLIHKKRIEEINSHSGEEAGSIKALSLDKETQIYNSHHNNGIASLLVNNGSFIVNRFATALYYNELVAINTPSM